MIFLYIYLGVAIAMLLVGLFVSAFNIYEANTNYLTSGEHQAMRHAAKAVVAAPVWPVLLPAGLVWAGVWYVKGLRKHWVNKTSPSS